MRAGTLGALFVVTALLLIVAAAGEIVIDDLVRPRSLFAYLLITTVTSGILGSVILEVADAKILS
jgi:hypothetical protein